MEHNNQFLKEQPSKLFLSYLIPSICATLVTSIYILADTMMIGKGVGAVGIAALNLLLQVFSVYVGTGILFGVGGSVLFSVSKGRGEEKKARIFYSCSAAGCLDESGLHVGVYCIF